LEAFKLVGYDVGLVVGTVVVGKAVGVEGLADGAVVGAKEKVGRADVGVAEGPDGLIVGHALGVNVGRNVDGKAVGVRVGIGVGAADGEALRT